MKAAATMLAATLSVGLVFPTHADDAKAAMASSGAIRMAASMNELALACSHMSARDVEAGRTRQRAAAIKDLGATPAGYDRM